MFGLQKTSVLDYDNVACKEGINKKIVLLTKEGMGIRSMYLLNVTTK